MASEAVWGAEEGRRAISVALSDRKVESELEKSGVSPRPTIHNDCDAAVTAASSPEVRESSSCCDGSSPVHGWALAFCSAGGGAIRPEIRIDNLQGPTYFLFFVWVVFVKVVIQVGFWSLRVFF